MHTHISLHLRISRSSHSHSIQFNSLSHPPFSPFPIVVTVCVVCSVLEFLVSVQARTTSQNKQMGQIMHRLVGQAMAVVQNDEATEKDQEESVEYLRLAHRFSRTDEVGTDSHAEYLTIKMQLAEALARVGELEQAEGLASEGLDIYETEFGRDSTTFKELDKKYGWLQEVNEQEPNIFS